MVWHTASPNQLVFLFPGNNQETEPCIREDIKFCFADVVQIPIPFFLILPVKGAGFPLICYVLDKKTQVFWGKTQYYALFTQNSWKIFEFFSVRGAGGLFHSLSHNHFQDQGPLRCSIGGGDSGTWGWSNSVTLRGRQPHTSLGGRWTRLSVGAFRRQL